MAACISFGLPLPARKPDDEESTLEGIQPETAQDKQAPRVFWPSHDDSCTSAQHDDALDASLKLGSEAKIRISVGAGPERTVFVVHEELICQVSGYFSAAMRNRCFAEARSREFDLADDDPGEFLRFARWLYSCRPGRACAAYDAEHACATARRPPDGGLRPWCGSPLELDYVFADRLLARAYCDFLLGHFVQHIEHVGFDRLQWIGENTLPDSPLQKLVLHWIGYLKSRTTTDWGPYVDLYDLVPGWTLKDPRKYQLAHWVQCPSDIHAECSHRRSYHHFDRRSAAIRFVIDNSWGSHRPRPAPSRWNAIRDSLRVALAMAVLVTLLAIPFALIGLSVSVFVHDIRGDVFYVSKIVSIVASCLASTGCVTASHWGRSRVPLLVLLALAAPMAAMSMFAVKLCISGEGSASMTAVCKLETGLGALQVFYTLDLLLVQIIWRH